MDGEVVIGINMDTKGFEIQIDTVEKELQELIEEYKLLKEQKPFEGQQRGLNELQKRIEQTRNKLVDLKQKQDNLNNTELTKIPHSLNGIGNSIEGVIKKVTRWGLAIFGIRSAYLFVRQAMSTLTQYNEQLATDVEYIRFAIATVLQPVIEKVVQLVFTLLQYVNYLAQAWFGINLFANASTKAFQKQNKAMGGTVKEAKELQKTLAGFDEMNILQENGDVSSGGGGGGTSLPIDDLSKKLKDIKIPKWLEKLIDFGKWVLDNWKDVVEALLTTKVFFDLLTGNWIGVIMDVIGLLAIEYAKILDIKKAVEDLNKIRDEENARAKKSQENTKKLIDTYNKVAETTGVTKEQTKIYVDTLLEGVKTNEEMISSMEKQKNWVGALSGENEKITKTQQEYNKTIEIQIGELKKLYDNGELNNKQKAQYVSLLDKQTTKLANENSTIDKNSQKFKDNTEKIKNNKAELEKITGKKYEVKTSIQTPNTSAFETALRNLFNKVSKWFGNISIGFGFGSGGAGFRAKGGIYYPSKLPKLAVGGIINQPGRGIPYHGATIAEKGAEAVVPLTDSQQMALLGEAIGRYITINANIPISMNGRLLSREIQKVQNQSNFAMNR